MALEAKINNVYLNDIFSGSGGYGDERTSDEI